MEHAHSLSRDEGRQVRVLTNRFLTPANCYVIGVAFLINVFLFALLPLIGQGDSGEKTLENIVPVNLVKIVRVPPPPPEEEKKLPEKKPPPKLLPTVRMEGHVPRKQELKMDLPRLSFEINPKLTWGMPVAAPDTRDFFYDQGDVDQAPIPVFKMKPIYPYRARRLGITGHVKVSFVVDKYGHVSRVKIIEADPPGIFEHSVLRTLPSWRFSPGKICDQPVATLFTTTVVFKLED
ncbi:MAG: energy transducer TonB [Proteobacteria bacterium]|nr:energy transducer TonB [Pseudomonadota bacterium]